MALPQIQIGGGMLGDALLASVDVVQELNQHWWCTVVCRQTEDNRVPVEDLLGQTVEIKTLDEGGVEHIHFSGFVYNVRLVYEVWGSYTAELTAVSDSYRMDVTAHKQYYADQTLSSIGGTVAGRNGVTVSVNAPSSKALNYVQYGETDFSFLNRLADDYGAWLRPKQGGVEIFASFQSGSTVQWRAEDGLIQFTLNGTLAPPSFSGSHYDHHVMMSNTFQQVSKPPQFFDAAQQLTGAVQSASSLLPTGFEPQRARAMTLDDYQTQLEAESERSLGGAVTGMGESRNQVLLAGNTLAIDGVLDAKGTYGLVKVTHRWTPQGYTNSFVCTPWKNYRNPQAPVARTWSGIVPARVVDHHDPKKMGRIKVQFFWQQDGSTHWARATAPHAGPDRGFMFMPEIGDEVAVAFEDGDPERPVILGSVWNGVQQAPRYDFRGADIGTNDVKRIVTKAGNRMHLSDKPGQETVFLATPHHTSLSMTELSDQTGRNLITLHSDGDIVLDAPNGRVHINSAFFSREIGVPAPPPAAVAPSPAPAPKASAAAAPEHAGGVGGLFSGLYDSTLKPLGHMVMHPIETAEGIGHAVAHPIQTGEAVGHAVSATTKAVFSGNTYAMGTALGTVGMFAVPGAGEAEGVEDAARLGQVGELGEAADLASNAEKLSTASTTGADGGTASGLTSDLGGAASVARDAAAAPALTTEAGTASTDIAETGAQIEDTAAVADRVAQARARQAAMLDSNVGYNISPTSWDAYPSIGRSGTFVSDQQGVLDGLGDVSGKSEITVPPETATQIEQNMGLSPGTLQDGFKIRQVEGLTDMAPRSPLEGNEYFLGPGQHLPGGAPEMVVNSIPTVDNEAVKTILNVKVGR